MTTIVGIPSPGSGVTLIADTRITLGWNQISTSPVHKVLCSYRIAIGICGTLKVINVVDNLDLEELSKRFDTTDMTPEEFIPNMIRSLRSTFITAGVYKESEDHFVDEITMLIAIADELFCVGTDLSYYRVQSLYEAIGSGAKYAIGAMDALTNSGIPQNFSPRALGLEALRVAINHDPGTGMPLTITRVTVEGAQDDGTTVNYIYNTKTDD